MPSYDVRMPGTAVAPGSITRRSRKLSGKVFVLFLIGVWIAVVIGVTFMIVRFKQGGVDALRIDQAKGVSPAPVSPASTSTPERSPR